MGRQRANPTAIEELVNGRRQRAQQTREALQTMRRLKGTTDPSRAAKGELAALEKRPKPEGHVLQASTSPRSTPQGSTELTERMEAELAVLERHSNIQ